MDSSVAREVETEAEARLSSPFHRLMVWLISTVGSWVIRAICYTVRWQIEGMEHHAAVLADSKRIIYVFWHGRILMATHFWRNRGIVVMTSKSREGDYIARLIQLFGYGAARGSSSRGSRRALLDMIRVLRNDRDVAFTIDGPRGPRYVAKPGAAWLAAKTGNAILPFHISCRDKWDLSSWDRFQIPKPFTRALVLIDAPIYVSKEAAEKELEEAQQKVQRSLDQLRERGDSYW